MNRFNVGIHPLEKMTHDYFWDDWLLLRERVADSAGTTNDIEYVWGPDLSGSFQGAGGIGGLLAVSVDGQYYFPFYDQIGNVLGYADESGSAVAAYDYDAFGNILSSTGPLASFFRHRFSTKLLDHDTGLCYYGYRWYSPALGRWISRDPIEEKGGDNLYGFCRNSPFSDFDPLGEAYFAYRPLDGMLNIFGVMGNDMDDKLNTVIGHEQLFFEDGKNPPNLGFFEDGTVHSDMTHSNYGWPHSIGWNDCIMRKAVKMVNPKPYSVLGKGLKMSGKYNCQDWAEAVRNAYNIIANRGKQRRRSK